MLNYPLLLLFNLQLSCSLPSHSLFVCLSLFGLYITHCLSAQSCSSWIGGGGRLMGTWVGSSSGASFVLFFFVWRPQASADACSVKLCPLGRFRKKISQGCSGAKVRSGAMEKRWNIFHNFTLCSLSLFYKTTLLTISELQYQNKLPSTLRTTRYSEPVLCPERGDRAPKSLWYRVPARVRCPQMQARAL